MLRSMMWDGQKGDDDFRAMMRDFVKQFANQAVSTEGFKRVVEKHINWAMDMDGNHRMDWFFNEWVYGTDIPSYRMEYSLTAEEAGKWILTGKLTQSGVSPGFKILVPFFAEYGGKKFRIGVASMQGNSSADLKLTLPEQPKRILLNLNYDVLTEHEEVKLIK
jgi:aminopeptidase N